MAAPRAENSSGWICRRYRLFFIFVFVGLTIQIFLGYSIYTFNHREMKKLDKWKSELVQNLSSLHLTGRPPLAPADFKMSQTQIRIDKNEHNIQDLMRLVQKQPNCTLVSSKEALSAMSRAKTDSCKQEIYSVACQNEQHLLYPSKIARSCNQKGKDALGKYLGCYKDDQKDRDMASFNVQFPRDNSPIKCINYCLTGGYQYAGVQYKEECWCGKTYGKHGILPETSCSSICPGNHTQTCGGYNAQRIFSTGLPEKKAVKAELMIHRDSVENLTLVRIVFVLTVNGRAVRQVLRLINRLYTPNHYFYIHVDSRSEYMYRELLTLEDKLPNVKLARRRYATIWGGASLLQAHLTFMTSLLKMTDWHWDYYINLSESDYPVKSVDMLTMFLTKYRGNNYLKSNGRETPVFIQKQGLNWLFYECDNHLWRLGKRDLPEGILFDGGSDWIGLYRDLVEHAVTSMDKLNTGLQQFYQYTLLPVESFFHTLLLNGPFCEKWVDNNLHLTNWKRKQGCKCQHKNQVDWCGCSPNVFTTADMERLIMYKGKVVFFGRKFEPVVNQEIINMLDNMMGIDISDMPALSHHWHNDYHHLDSRDSRTDVWLTYMHSLLRRNQQVLGSASSTCSMSSVLVLESHVLNVADHFYRYLVKYNVTLAGGSVPFTLESQFSYRQHYRVIDPLAIGRLQSLEVGTDFDVKELLFRNYPKYIGPESEPALRHVWSSGKDMTVSVAWIDPAGIIAAYQDITIMKESVIDAHKPKLKLPLRPGVWTVKLLYRLKICAEVQFIVLPLTLYKGVPLTMEKAEVLHNGPTGLYTHTDYSDLTQKLGVKDPKKLLSESQENGRKIGTDLEQWVDKLSAFSWALQDTCSLVDIGTGCPPLDKCSDTRWSSLSSDPKSEITQIMFSNLKIR